MARGGARELLVTAQDTACYGFDLGTDLSDLLSSLTCPPWGLHGPGGDDEPGQPGSHHRPLRSHWKPPKVYQFLHLPVQSGSAAVLEAMNRGYGPSSSSSWSAVCARRRRA